MSCYDDVAKIGKKLSKMIKEGTSDHAQNLDILRTLKKQPMTLDVLQKTGIGITVNNFRKSSSDDEVISLAKSLIKSWKKLLPDNSSQGSSSSSQLSRSSSTTDSPKEEDASMTSQTGSGEGSSSSGDKTPSADQLPKQTSFPACAEDTSDSVRLKCREMIANALKLAPVPEDGGDADNIAAAIETCIFDEYKNTDMKYKNRVRSRYSNLKDNRNPELRAQVLKGNIPAAKIAVMTSDEMASDRMKELRAKLTKEAINDHQMSVTGGTTTDLLKCGKCQKRNCTYNQVQTRSADEPMTTFVLCNNCGNRWKFC